MGSSISRIKGAGFEPDLPWKLWIYTNYDCNLSCNYCLASSTPHSPRLGTGTGYREAFSR
jgi:hypothetical protein